MVKGPTGKLEKIVVPPKAPKPRKSEALKVFRLFVFTEVKKEKYSLPFQHFVIIARDEKRARELANNRHGSEGEIWEDPTKTYCVEISLKEENITCYLP